MQNENDGKVTPAEVAQEVLMVNSVVEVDTAEVKEAVAVVMEVTTATTTDPHSAAVGVAETGALGFEKNPTISLMDSPHIGGRKMSSSLKNKLMNSKKYSSPISRPSISVKSIQSKVPSLEYSREDIEKAMNETEPVLNKSASIAVFVLSDDEDDLYEKSTSNKTSAILIDDAKESITSGEHAEFVVNSDSSKENGSETKLPENESPKKEIDVTVINEGICSCSEQDIENCVDKESVLKIFNDLQKEFVDNQERLRKLKLVKKHYTENTPEALKSLNKKWMTCTQLALRKLYDFMPEPRSATFEAFLTFLQVDFDAVNYNPETDSFA